MKTYSESKSKSTTSLLLLLIFNAVLTFLLQEELSKQISSLIHSFQHVDGRKFPTTRFSGISLELLMMMMVFLPAEFLFLESFLQTFKREWTGIDRLRMDKFFQVSVKRIQDEF